MWWHKGPTSPPSPPPVTREMLLTRELSSLLEVENTPLSVEWDGHTVHRPQSRTCRSPHSSSLLSLPHTDALSLSCTHCWRYTLADQAPHALLRFTLASEDILSAAASPEHLTWYQITSLREREHCLLTLAEDLAPLDPAGELARRAHTLSKTFHTLLTHPAAQRRIEFSLAAYHQAPDIPGSPALAVLVDTSSRGWRDDHFFIPALAWATARDGGKVLVEAPWNIAHYFSSRGGALLDTSGMTPAQKDVLVTLWDPSSPLFSDPEKAAEAACATCPA